MKRILFLVFAVLLIFSCENERKINMTVKGQIKGLKKGKLYLQKMNDTILVSVDSISLNGTDTYELKDYVESPVIYYLTFDANNSKKNILFFGEEGLITINDNVENFGLFPEINGSKNQDIYAKYKLISQKFQNQNLELIKKNFDAKKANDEDLVKKLEEDYKRLIRRKVLYTANFAISNSNSEVAPFIGLTELYDATIPLLDTLNSSLTTDVKNSYYGKRYQEYLDSVKKKEKK